MLNEKKQFKISLIEILFVLIVAYSIAPIVSRFISTYLTTYFYMLVVLLAVALIMIKRKLVSLERCIILLFPFLCWNILTYFIKTDGLILWGYKVLLNLLPVLLGYYLINYCRRKDAFFPWLVFLLLAITVITTIVGCIQYPEAARYLATVADAQEADAVMYGWRNLGGYEFTYTVVLLHPLVILAYKRKKLKLIWAILASIAVFTLAIYTEYTTALLLCILTSTLYFFKKELNWKHMIGLVIVAILLFIVFQRQISEALLYLSRQVKSENISARLEALAGGREGIANSDDDRIALYEKSLNTFFKYPIFGTFIRGGGGTGGHSFILDYIAQFGIVGVTLLVFMYRTIYKKFFLPYKKKDGFGYVFWLFLQTLVLSTVNTGMWLMVLAVYVPIYLKVIYPEEKKA